MKLFLAFSAVILAASAMPTQFGEEAEVYLPADIVPEDVAAFNGSSRNAPGITGFASINGGTTGGAGGATWTVWDAWALRDACRGNDRRIVNVRGRIDLTVLFTSSPGVSIPVGNHKTIIGGDRNAMIFGGGLSLNSVHNIIIENLRLHNALSYAPGERPNGSGGIQNQVAGPYSEIDGIGIRTSTNIWINHCELADDPWNAFNTPENRRRHDGLIDIVRGANFISISNTIFRNHNHVMLVGNDDNNAAQDRGRLKVTYYDNWFQGTNQRNPRVRYGEVHIVNNLFTDITFYGIGVGNGASIFVQNNVFRNTRRAWVHAGSQNPAGHLLASNNLLHSSSHDSGISSSGVNWTPSQYYWYGLRSVHQTEDHVRRHAGIQ